MATKRNQTRNPVIRLWDWAKSQIVQEVPEDIMICEFDCRERQCAMGDWAVCDRRLNQAAGEVMPDRRSHAPKP